MCVQGGKQSGWFGGRSSPTGDQEGGASQYSWGFGGRQPPSKIRKRYECESECSWKFASMLLRISCIFMEQLWAPSGGDPLFIFRDAICRRNFIICATWCTIKKLRLLTCKAKWTLCVVICNNLRFRNHLYQQALHGQQRGHRRQHHHRNNHPRICQHIWHKRWSAIHNPESSNVWITASTQPTSEMSTQATGKSAMVEQPVLMVLLLHSDSFIGFKA